MNITFSGLVNSSRIVFGYLVNNSGYIVNNSLGFMESHVPYYLLFTAFIIACLVILAIFVTIKFRNLFENSLNKFILLLLLLIISFIIFYLFRSSISGGVII